MLKDRFKLNGSDITLFNVIIEIESETVDWIHKLYMQNTGTKTTQMHGINYNYLFSYCKRFISFCFVLILFFVFFLFLYSLLTHISNRRWNYICLVWNLKYSTTISNKRPPKGDKIRLWGAMQKFPLTTLCIKKHFQIKSFD